MSALTKVAGYPVHAVTEYGRWENNHGTAFTQWQATCGAQGRLVGAMSAFGEAGKARKAELCRSCFPAGHNTHHPNPHEVPLCATCHAVVASNKQCPTCNDPHRPAHAR